MIKKLIPVAAAVMLLAACHSHKLPEGVMTEDQMVEFLSEAYLIEGYYAIATNYNYDSLTDEAQADYQALLKRQKVTMEQVETSLDYYARHGKEYTDIHQRALKNIDEALKK